MAAFDMKELGSSGLKKSGGYVLEEFIRAWQGQQKWRTIEEMKQDPIICGVLLAIELSLRQVKCEVTPKDDTPAAADIAEFVEGALDDMSMTWADNLSEILTMLPYGFCWQEVVFKRRMGDNRDSGKASKYTDGKIGWRKWAIRSQDSLERWEFDDEGGLAGMWQYQWYTPGAMATVLIPIEKSLLFRPSSHKNNPEPSGILRGAYEAYYYKHNISRIEAIGIERDLAGLPVAYMPAEYLSSSATSSQQALFATMKEIVTNIRRDEQEGVIFPLAYDESGNKLFELTLLASGGQRSFNTDAIIARYDQRMAIAMLADFILLGHEQVGSYALSATKASLFKTALEAWLQAIADVINTHAIPRLLRLNGMDIMLAPSLGFGKVGEIQLTDITEFLKTVAGAGMQLFPSLELENHLRSILDFPMLDEQEYTDREAQKQAQADAIAGQTQPQNGNAQGKGNQPGDGGQKQNNNADMSRNEQAALVQAAAMMVARG